MPSNLLSIARLVLGILAGLLVSHGLLTADQTTAFVSDGLGAVSGIGAVVWIVYKNAHAKATITAAVATGVVPPPDTAVAAIKAGLDPVDLALATTPPTVPSVPPALAIAAALLAYGILSACSTAQIDKATQDIQAACNDVLPLTQDPAVIAAGTAIPVVAQVSAAVQGGCGTAEGIVAMAQSASTVAWLGTAKTVLVSKGAVLPAPVAPAPIISN